MAKTLVYVGTYTRRGSEGIYLYAFDSTSGDMALLGTAGGVENPSFLEVAPSKRTLYATDEVGTFLGKPGGGVSAFHIEHATGELTLLNHQLSHGAAPCHVSVDPSEQYVLVANYTGGSVAVLPIQEDGSLGPATDVVQHHGSGPNPRRQERAHAHSITPDRAGRYAYVADLGLDRVMVYRLDPAGRLVPHDEPWMQIHPGAGPRHLAFHIELPYAYVINELDSTIIACAFVEARGSMRPLQTLPTVPAGFDGENWCADVHVSPCGRFLYGSNRGHDSIAVFAIDPEDGRLTPLGYTSTQGRWPRNFAIDPHGRFLLAANEKSDSIVVLRIDGETGALAPTGIAVDVPVPVCVRFVELP
ncbi:MAG: lactonase family protein [Anaerolineae bacterium]|nr:lactonase family protein [Anaerolineae bacterium]